MFEESFNLFALFILGLLYLFMFAKIQHAFFLKLSQPKKNHAVLIVYVASLIAASIGLSCESRAPPGIPQVSPL